MSVSEPSITIVGAERDLILGSGDKSVALDFHHVASEIVMRLLTSSDALQFVIRNSEAGKLRDWLATLKL